MLIVRVQLAALGASDVVGLGTWLRIAYTQHHMRLSASTVNKGKTFLANASRCEMAGGGARPPSRGYPHRNLMREHQRTYQQL